MAAWGYCPSGRFFEAAACGTPILTDFWPGLDQFFDVDEELFLARDGNDVREALALPAADRERIAQLARERTLDQHTGAVRAQQFLRACEEAASLDLNRMQQEAAS